MELSTCAGLTPSDFSNAGTSRRISEPVPSYEMPFRLLDLPGELRNRIYEECLVTGSIQPPWNFVRRLKNRRSRAKSKRGSKKRGMFARGSFAGLLRVSRLVHRESCSILYGTNHFSFCFDLEAEQLTLSRASSAFLRHIGMANAGLIRNLDFWFSVDNVPSSSGGRPVGTRNLALPLLLQNTCRNITTLTVQFILTWRPGGFGWSGHDGPTVKVIDATKCIRDMLQVPFPRLQVVHLDFLRLMNAKTQEDVKNELENERQKPRWQYKY